MNRRTFFERTGIASIFSSIDASGAGSHPFSPMNKQFELLVLATSWGYPGSLDEYCAAAKKEGYDGIETWWPMEIKTQQELVAALKKNDLRVGFLCGSSGPDFKTHFDSFKTMTSAAARFKDIQPLYINCHSGHDYFPAEQNQQIIDFTIALSKQTGVLICHETHRSRMLFAAHTTREFLNSNPDMKITLDISHWCNVHESLLTDQPESVALALERAEHIHARIGHPEGPQVNDPRAPEWADTVKAHFSWWDKIVARKKQAGERLTILTEFGPPDYMPTKPYSREPLSDQWEVNVHMMKLLRKRYLS